VANADIKAEPMADYRMYFLVADRIGAREDFQADNDIDAIRIAQVLRNACSDRCDTFELWKEKRIVDTARGSQPVSFAELTQPHQQLVLETEEAILKSDWIIAQSKTLIERIERQKTGWADVK
jgi:hypothetical protein